MANHLGGRVVFSGRREYGAGVLHIKNGSELLGGLGKQLDVWNSHGDEVTALPKGFRVAGRHISDGIEQRRSSRRRCSVERFYAVCLLWHRLDSQLG